MKKPYDYRTDYAFCSPAIVRTSNVRVSAKNCDLIRKFFADLMKKRSAHEVMCFVRKEFLDGKVVRESQKVSASTFDLEDGDMFSYIHTVGVSERIIVSKAIKGVHVENVYTISG